MRTELGLIIDKDKESFASYCESKSLGEILGLKNLLCSTYEEVRSKKDALIEKIVSGELPESSCRPVLDGLYSSLFKIEEKVFFLKSLISERS